jgi:hypothetical protein
MIGWASSALVLTAVVAILAKVSGVIVAPGARGLASASVVEVVDTASGAFAYTLMALLVALVCAASFELARARRVHIVARGAVVACSGLIVALASPAVVERLTDLPSLGLAVITSVVALVAGIVVVRAPRARAVGAILTLLAVCGLLRVVAWETSALAFDHMSQSTHDVARAFATVAVALHGVATLVAAAWIGTRSKWRGRVLANVAIVVAFGCTWLSARTTEAPSGFEALLRAALPAAVGLPSPYLLGAIAAFLLPASILLSAVAVAQTEEAPEIVTPLVLALLSHGAYDVPLHALLVTASAQWAMLAMAESHRPATPRAARTPARREEADSRGAASA